MSSSSPSAGSGGETVVFLLFLIVLFALRRVYRSYRGMRFSAVRTIGFAAFYVTFGSLFSILSFFEGVQVIWALPYVALMLGATLWSYGYTDRRISFWSGGDGSVYFKGGVVLYLIYIVGLVARLSIDVIFLGPNFYTIDPNEVLTSTALTATIATDLLLMFGLGLLVGRNARVLRRYRLIEQGKEHLPDSPPDYKPIFGPGKDASAS